MPAEVGTVTLITGRSLVQIQPPPRTNEKVLVCVQELGRFERGDDLMT
jgi:hypothetical protein